MTTVIAGMIVTAGLVLAGLIAGIRALVLHRRTPSQGRDETVRAGSVDDPDGYEAARRATGTTAWIRPDGGGGL